MSYFSDLPPYLDDLLVVIYFLILITTIVRILLDTQSTSKTLAYILLVIILPIIGVIFYYSFGINYRHHKLTKKRASRERELLAKFKNNVPDKTTEMLKAHPLVAEQFGEVIRFIDNLAYEFLSLDKIKLLINGEEKFPEVLKSLAAAEKFIHMEYYDWENDTRGNQIKDVLLERAKQGVKVRVMFDAYASRKIKHNIVKELKAGGIEIYPVIRIKLDRFANRMNHRDHRKIIIIDGHTGFLGGINISDRYDNSIDTGLYWRDTHVKIEGRTVLNMQRHFIVNWNSCQPDELDFSKELFPDINVEEHANGHELAQIVAGGPIYPLSNIMLTYFKIFTQARSKLYITNPYFIPSESIMDALIQAAISGVDVRLLMPEKSDSAIVGASAKFYYSSLLKAGVRIFLYKKGFVHAKTVVMDAGLSIVGTANMDIRSFQLNFEMMSVIYGDDFARQLENAFLDDLKLSVEINKEVWFNQSVTKKLSYAVARLSSSFL